MRTILYIILIIFAIAVIGAFFYFKYPSETPSNETPSNEKYIEGWVVDAYQINTTNINGTEYLLWSLSLSENYQDIKNSTTYLVLFPADGYPAPPIEDVKCRFYYTNEGEYLLIYKVKSL